MLKFYEYFTDFEKFSTLSRKLSWSHFVELLQVQDKIKIKRLQQCVQMNIDQ